MPMMYQPVRLTEQRLSLFQRLTLVLYPVRNGLTGFTLLSLGV